MNEKLKKHHEKVISLYAEAYDYFSQINKNEGLRQQLSKWLTLVSENSQDKTFIGVNKRSIEKHRIASKNPDGVIKDKTYKFIDDAINNRKEKIEKRKVEIEKIAKKHVVINQENNGLTSKKLPTNKYVNLNDELMYMGENFTLLKNLLNEYYNEKVKEYGMKNIKRKMDDFSERYKTLMFDFNRSKGKGWYDYFGEYRFSNIKNQDDFEEGLRELKEKGYDIVELKREKTANDMVIILLTNSGNVSAIHDIVYQRCNHKRVKIEGRFVVPVFNQEFDMSIIEAPENNMSAYRNYKNGASNMLPEILRSQFLSSIDAYSIGKGLPQKATFSSSCSQKIEGRTKRIHVYDKDPTKLAKKIVVLISEQNSLDSFLSDKLEKNDDNLTVSLRSGIGKSKI